MKQYISPSNSKTFKAKTKEIKELINISLYILDCFGIPMNQTNRRLEKMAISFLACGNIKKKGDLKIIKDSNSGYSLGTRQIIEFVNKNFGENISKGSYDDIRRKDLILLTTADIILQSSPDSNPNDSTRGYNINPIYADLIKAFGDVNWEKLVQQKLNDVEPLSVRLKRKRLLKKLNVQLPSGINLSFLKGEHNQLQKLIIEEFLPRYGFDSEVLYVGDATNKYLFLEEEKLKKLNFFEIAHDKLPDVIAYSKKKNWIYLIEAVFTSNPIDEIRLITLSKLTQNCKAEIVYVTAFLDKLTFRKFIADIAWETEVWIADNPDHLIHFNGNKFLGPY